MLPLWVDIILRCHPLISASLSFLVSRRDIDAIGTGKSTPEILTRSPATLPPRINSPFTIMLSDANKDLKEVTKVHKDLQNASELPATNLFEKVGPFAFCGSINHTI
jgi:hypothetical protein